MRARVPGATRWQPLLGALVLCLSIFAAVAAEFTSPTLGTSLNEPSDLEIQNVQLLNQLGVTTLKFSRLTMFLSTVQPGDLLVEDPGVNTTTKPRSNPADPLHQTEPVLADYLPFEVSGIALVGGEVHVTGHVRSLLEVLKSATFFQDARFDAYDAAVRDPYNPTLENTYTAAEKPPARCWPPRLSSKTRATAGWRTCAA